MSNEATSSCFVQSEARTKLLGPMKGEKPTILEDLLRGDDFNKHLFPVLKDTSCTKWNHLCWVSSSSAGSVINHCQWTRIRSWEKVATCKPQCGEVSGKNCTSATRKLLHFRLLLETL